MAVEMEMVEMERKMMEMMAVGMEMGTGHSLGCTCGWAHGRMGVRMGPAHACMRACVPEAHYQQRLAELSRAVLAVLGKVVHGGRVLERLLMG